MIPLEKLTDGSPTARNFDKLAQLTPDTGGQTVGIRFGQQNVTWPGATAQSSYITFDHGLGTTPITVVATPNDETGSGRCAVVAFFNATQITLRLENAAGTNVANTVSTPVSWIAIG